MRSDGLLKQMSLPQPRGYFLAFSFSFLASGLCVLDLWILPHSSTRSQTLCGGTASLHCGQIFNAGATRKSWLLRIPCADGDLRRFGTATNSDSRSRSESINFEGKAQLSESGPVFQELVRRLQCRSQAEALTYGSRDTLRGFT